MELNQWCEERGRCEETEFPESIVTATDLSNPLLVSASTTFNWLAWKVVQKLAVSFIIMCLWFLLQLAWRCLSRYFQGDQQRFGEHRAIDYPMHIVDYEEEEQDDADCD